MWTGEYRENLEHPVASSTQPTPELGTSQPSLFLMHTQIKREG